MTGFDETVVAAAFDVAALPPDSPLHVIERIQQQHCPACHARYGPPEADGSWLASVCYPPTVDYPIPGCEMPIPAWCAARQAFVWRNADGALESDRPCVGCGNTGRIPVGSLEDGTPLSWRSCPRCCPTPAEIQAHEKAVAAYGEDYF